ncbi:MAG: hypothetical protein ACI84C_002912 [Flavobacteriales bacterium]|jgi:hypothetical protein
MKSCSDGTAEDDGYVSSGFLGDSIDPANTPMIFAK